MATAPPPAAPAGGDSMVLREYLVALGFRIDETRARRADNFITGLDKKAAFLGRSLVGVGVAAVGLAVLFSRSMERLFYSARYADTTVGRLQALEFAGRNIGLAGGEMTAGVKSMAAAIRGNPGLVGMLEKMGVPVKGRDMADVMWDFVRATKSMPFYVAQQFGEMFGMGPETLFNLQKGLDIGLAAEARRRQMAKDMGVDADELAKGMVEVNNVWREIIENTSVGFQAIAYNLLPQIKSFKEFSAGILKDWVAVSKVWSEDMERVGTEDLTNRMLEGLGFKDAGGTRAVLTEEQKRRIGAPLNDLGPRDAYELSEGHERRWKRLLRKLAPGMLGPTLATDPAAVDATQDLEGFRTGGVGDTSPGGTDVPGMDPQDYLRGLERKYGLPPGLLDRVWNRESGRGVNMLSPRGARGHFGFMPKTQRAYGLKDPDDFLESADASARMWSDLMRQFGGDTRMAAAAYNWGSGNLTRYGLGGAPAETRGYMDAVAGPSTANVNTEIHVHGVSDPARAADAVAQKQRDVAADALRNLGPKMK